MGFTFYIDLPSKMWSAISYLSSLNLIRSNPLFGSQRFVYSIEKLDLVVAAELRRQVPDALMRW
jgi:hypothetical protein